MSGIRISRYSRARKSTNKPHRSISSLRSRSASALPNTANRRRRRHHETITSGVRRRHTHINNNINRSALPLSLLLLLCTVRTRWPRCDACSACTHHFRIHVHCAARMRSESLKNRRHHPTHTYPEIYLQFGHTRTTHHQCEA